MIKLVVLDVDGTLTDGKLYIDNMGNEMKAFDVKDGLAISQSIKQGIKFAIITGKTSKIVERRGKELGIQEIVQGSWDKVADLEKILKKYNLTFEETAYIGDDLIDLKPMKLCGFSACPKDSAAEIIEISDFISSKNGGCGAVREVLEFILKKQNLWNNIIENFTATEQ
ncbi:HAD-IIIA family hydrolase [Fusobacterium perfoetens]|uniref:KdsC family phosphatase n=1 Tax=Fusobacterium perfoetens TaxID=852 RepID=UPI001F3A7CC9|nr:HAD-IIIA family hydrolase [Fusobacterium perfoetens]MCF2624850.1 HAD-IIIA family hydrolase [Fusobacterium perfoetens]